MDFQGTLHFLIPTVAFLLAALVDRWWVALLPVTSWVLFFLGLDAGWWGYGYGDGWHFALVGQSLLGVGAVVAGLLVRRFIIRRKGPRVPTGP
ncbi:MAG: hypothetical protein ACREA0_03030 [bacterium]